MINPNITLFSTLFLFNSAMYRHGTVNTTKSSFIFLPKKASSKAAILICEGYNQAIYLGFSTKLPEFMQSSA